MTQANKVKKADEVLKFFLEYVDGKYAASLSDVRIVTSVGVLTCSGMAASTTLRLDNQTIAQFLMASGLELDGQGRH